MGDSELTENRGAFLELISLNLGAKIYFEWSKSMSSVLEEDTQLFGVLCKQLKEKLVKNTIKAYKDSGSHDLHPPFPDVRFTDFRNRTRHGNRSMVSYGCEGVLDGDGFVMLTNDLESIYINSFFCRTKFSYYR